MLSVALSAAALPAGIEAYGLGFLASAAITSAAGLVHLRRYMAGLEYNVFCRQPLFYEEPDGLLLRTGRRVEALEKRVTEKRAAEKKAADKRKKAKRAAAGKKAAEKKKNRRKDNGA